MDTLASMTNPQVTGEIDFSSEEIQEMYQAVFRDSTDQPGFYYKDFGAKLDSKSFRKLMIELKERLSALCQEYLQKQLNYHWMCRANHRNSSNFHRDTSTEQSFLMLGYEPTSVDSKAYIADYTRYLENHSISIREYFQKSLNDNYAPNDEVLSPYVSELNPFPKENYRLVIINNSRSYGEKSFGVFHRGEVPENFEQKDRLVNAIMLTLCSLDTSENHGEHVIANFMNSDSADN